MEKMEKKEKEKEEDLLLGEDDLGVVHPGGDLEAELLLLVGLGEELLVDAAGPDRRDLAGANLVGEIGTLHEAAHEGNALSILREGDEEEKESGGREKKEKENEKNRENKNENEKERWRRRRRGRMRRSRRRE